LGLKYFYTGKPCRNGHTDKRSVTGGRCMECNRAAANLHNKRYPLQASWRQMINRCYNEFSASYEDYGARGITVCDRWRDPVNGYARFLADMGPRPEGFSLDRINNDGNYTPRNCRWADLATQSRNKRWTKLKGEDVIEAFRMLDAGATQRAVARHYKCDQANIWRMNKRREIYIEQGLDCRPQKAAG
jgi:hypothetical protein